MSPKLVIVHERFTELGGSELVVGQLAELAHHTRVYAPLVDDRLTDSVLHGAEVSYSSLQRLYRTPGRYAHLLPLLPMAMANADLSDADVVITSHHAFANRVRVPDGVPLISYTHSPARWMWDRGKLAGESGGRAGGAALRTFATAARRSDKAAANRVDCLIANSQTVAERIRDWWGRHASVIHPGVDVDYFDPSPAAREDFFLVAGRLVPYKNVQVAVEAATALGLPLIVAGQGRARPMLERLAGPTVEFVGAVSRAELRELFRRCRALLFPGEEDFGIVPVEAQGCGAPVIATRAGGATETVIDGRTGVLVETVGINAVAAFAKALLEFDPDRFDPTMIRANAERFSLDRFHRRMNDVLAARVPGWPNPRPMARIATTPEPVVAAGGSL